MRLAAHLFFFKLRLTYAQMQRREHFVALPQRPFEAL